MPLTKEDVALLTAPFLLDQHEFVQQFVYVAELAVTQRLSAVDPAWELRIAAQWHDGDFYNCTAELIVAGTCRQNTGSYRVVKGSYAEPEKSAVTDALRRCARMFGVGSYLLNAPEGEQNFKKWYQRLYGGENQPPAPNLGSGVASGASRTIGRDDKPAPKQPKGVQNVLVDVCAVRTTWRAGTPIYEFFDDTAKKPEYYTVINADPFDKILGDGAHRAWRDETKKMREAMLDKVYQLTLSPRVSKNGNEYFEIINIAEGLPLHG